MYCNESRVAVLYCHILRSTYFTAQTRCRCANCNDFCLAQTLAADARAEADTDPLFSAALVLTRTTSMLSGDDLLVVIYFVSQSIVLDFIVDVHMR